MKNEKHLLDILWEMVGCEYLSDLRTKRYRSAALQAICHVDKNDYSAKMWNETLSYILGKNNILNLEELGSVDVKKSEI